MLRKTVFSMGLLFCAMIVQSHIMAQGLGHNFPVPEGHWAYAAVHGLMEEGILEGYPDDTYRGKRAITRIEFATALRRALSCSMRADTLSPDQSSPPDPSRQSSTTSHRRGRRFF